MVGGVVPALDAFEDKGAVSTIRTPSSRDTKYSGLRALKLFTALLLLAFREKVVLAAPAAQLKMPHVLDVSTVGTSGMIAPPAVASLARS